MTQLGIIPTSAARQRTAVAAKDRTRVWLASIVIVAAGLRVALLVMGPGVDVERAYEPDSGRYVELSENLKLHRVFGKGREDSGVVHIPLARLRTQRGELEAADEHGLRPEVFRTPGYPAWIALFTSAGVSLRWVLAAQVVLSVFNVILVFALARQLMQSRRIALVAAFIMAMHPAAALASISVLSETLFTSLILCGLYMAVRWRDWPFDCTGAGLLFGVAVLVRPVGILLGPAVALWLLVTGRTRRAALCAACLTVSSLLPAAAWMVRNHRVGIGYQISTVPAVNAMFYTVAYMRIAETGGDYATDWPATVDTLFAELRDDLSVDETTLNAMTRMSVAEIAGKPKLYGKVMARSAVKFFTDHSAGPLMTRLGRPYHATGMRERLLRGDFSLDGVADHAGFAVAAGWTLWNLALVGFMILGAGALAWRRHWSALLLLAGIMMYFVLTTQANGLERFRIPVLGVQALLAAAVIMALPKRRLSAAKTG